MMHTENHSPVSFDKYLAEYERAVESRDFAAIKVLDSQLQSQTKQLKKTGLANAKDPEKIKRQINSLYGLVQKAIHISTEEQETLRAKFKTVRGAKAYSEAT